MPRRPSDARRILVSQPMNASAAARILLLSKRPFLLLARHAGKQEGPLFVRTSAWPLAAHPSFAQTVNVHAARRTLLSRMRGRGPAPGCSGEEQTCRSRLWQSAPAGTAATARRSPRRRSARCRRPAARSSSSTSLTTTSFPAPAARAARCRWARWLPGSRRSTTAASSRTKTTSTLSSASCRPARA